MPEPGTILAAAVALERTAKAIGLTAGGEEFFKRIGGALGGTVAEALGNVKARREENATSTLNRAAEISAAAGLEPRPVPLRLLAPILDGASVEDEPSMQERWAALLANATANPDAIPPLFPRMLAELTPAAAQLLDTIGTLQEAGIRTGAGFRIPLKGAVDYVGGGTDLLLDYFDAAMILEAFSLIARQSDLLNRKPGIGADTAYLLTDLGDAFLSACRTLAWPQAA